MGDVFMTLIHTAELHGVNAFGYLVELLRHAREVRDHADAWMPWNYRETLRQTAERLEEGGVRGRRHVEPYV